LSNLSCADLRYRRSASDIATAQGKKIMSGHHAAKAGLIK
jgi:hypothetical protein